MNITNPHEIIITNLIPTLKLPLYTHNVKIELHCKDEKMEKNEQKRMSGKRQFHCLKLESNGDIWLETQTSEFLSFEQSFEEIR